MTTADIRARKPNTELETRIMQQEGFRDQAYRDSNGHHTIGWGHLITDPLACAYCTAYEKDPERPRIPVVTLRRWFDSDMVTAFHDLSFILAGRPHIGSSDINPARLAALIEMAFVLGRGGVEGFSRMWSAITNSDWSLAANELIDSAWYDDNVGAHARIEQLAHILRHGDFPPLYLRP